MKARAQVLVGPAEFQLREVEVPLPGPGELRVRVRGCGICGSDKFLAQVCPPDSVLGHEVVGEVELCGAEVGGWRIGDRAIPVGDGIGMGGSERLGGFSELLVVSADVCVRVPETLPSRQAVLAEPVANGLHFVRRARLRPGQRVAILGAGQIGLSVLFWARRLGADRIAVSEPVQVRAQLARDMGADGVLNPRDHDNLSASITEVLGGRPDVVFEAVGQPDIMTEAVHMVGGRRGVVVIAGITMEQIVIQPLALALKETDLVFPIGTVAEEVKEVLAVLARGEFPAKELVSHRISQRDIPTTLRDLGRPTDQIKVVVDYEKGDRSGAEECPS